ncbi:hypothetical protein CC78DRAFT_569996 [Lojkania enalia]|uniref:GPI anchored protein n=1 Tax=Lojkania enalia TaxID=147567 RepID=A0A9P4N7J1_9PLEO|nr:hypothetical protein CC78DRAFT_569996 [Didymosphaeria enalia]
MSRIFFLLPLLPLATAQQQQQQQTTTLTLPFYAYDQMPIAASILAAAPSATTLELSCAPGTDGSDCGLFPYQTLTIGPSTYHMDMSVPGDGFTGTQDCSRSAGSAVCVESAGGQEANFPGKSTETYGASDVASLAVTVTAGAELLTATETGGPAVTQVTGTSGVSGSTGVEPTGSGAGTEPTGAAAANRVVLGGGVAGAVAGLLGGLVL